MDSDNKTPTFTRAFFTREDAGNPPFEEREPNQISDLAGRLPKIAGRQTLPK